MMDSLQLDYRIVDTFEDLQRVAEGFETQRSVAVDLEADSMYHFQERVCLIQMASRNLSVVIDPLKIGDLSPLRSVFENPRIQKIFHGADYDVRSLYRDFSFNINQMFDTQVACRFLGIRQTGLDAVLQERFGIRLDKKYQKKDWSRRPLPPEMIEIG
ncbi:MAG: ribonuclease D, partial [Desulfobacterales bacterium]|nr:ribonuclease D [Desulfobacterales bacterium]